MLEQLWSIREDVKKRKPLVVNITNTVVTNFTANVLLAAGASPIMSEGEDEAEELTKISDAIVLNIGTLHPRQVGYFKKIGACANMYGKPLIFDPVGVGATGYRTETALQLLEQLQVNFIRGNYGEIGKLAGTSCGMRGVDSVSSQFDTELTRALAVAINGIACATGETDYLSDGTATYINRTGHELLQLVTGTGCALTSLMGAFMAVGAEPIMGGLAALAFYGAAAEKAAGLVKGPGSFAASFIDALYNLTFEEFKNIAGEKVSKLGEVDSGL